MIRYLIATLVAFSTVATCLMPVEGCTPADSQIVAYAAARHACIVDNDAAAPARECLANVDKQYGQYDAGGDR